MSLLKKSPTQETSVLPNYTSTNVSTQREDELTIHVPKSFRHSSAMPEALKTQVRVDAPSLADLLEQTLTSKGEYDASKISWNGQDEVTIEGLSNLSLHSFVLQAEELGKTVTYTQTLTVKVSD